MTTKALSLNEKNPVQVNEAIRQLQQGRNNAHGTFTLTGDGTATSKSVTAPNCAAGSHVSLTPTTAHAAAVTGLYVVAANGSFTVNHAVTSESDCTFTYGIVG